MNKQLTVLFCFACVLTVACQQTSVNRPATVAGSPTPGVTRESAYRPGPQPSEDELRQALERNYEDVVTLDHRQSIPFVIGDFNGDNSEDIAIVVKPSRGKVADLSGEYVNWILEDPQQVQQGRVAVRNDELLLAVIHGHEREGWRNAMARQTYLLKNSVGEGFQTQPANQLRTDSRSLPPLKGDVIREKLRDKNGIIYWTGARYAWHPVS
jgi:hypothetical protein